MNSLRIIPAMFISMLAHEPVQAWSGSFNQNIQVSESRYSLDLACDQMANLHFFEAGKGFNSGVDLLASQAARIRIDLNLTFLPHNRGKLATISGKFDGLCTCSSDEELDEALLVSRALGTVSVGALVRQNDNLAPTRQFLEKGNQLTWGFVRDDALSQTLIEMGINKFNTLDTREQGLRMLDLHRLDVLLVREPMAEKYGNDPNHAYSYFELNRSTIHFCASGAKANELIEAINNQHTRQNTSHSYLQGNFSEIPWTAAN